jgi:hypothetical protein
MALKAERLPAIRIAKRYVRSVEINRDLDDPRALDGYVVTPSVRDAAYRILSGLAKSSTQRAFRVTGPYGVGKSAFAVLIARLVAEGTRRTGPAWTLLRNSQVSTIDTPRYTPIVLVGRRINLADALVEAIGKAADGKGGGKRAAKVARTAAALMHERAKGQRDDAAVLRLLSDYAVETKGGVLLLVDEFGRYLEYAALHRREIDPSFFQQLAELAGGVQPFPIAVIGFLHHRFSDYAAGLGEWVEAEWIRSSERYEDILFHDSTEQTAFLLAHAIVHEPTPAGEAASTARRLYGEAVGRGIFATSGAEMAKIAPSLAPLHPASVAALSNLASRFGQNERSVFGFLQSLEPFGFQRFLHDKGRDRKDWYRLADLHDYVAGQGGAKFRSADRERRWDLLKNAVAQSDKADGAEIAVLKTIGMISVLEPVPGLRADAGTVAWCAGLGVKEAEQAIRKLTARNVLYKRPHRDDFSLWASTSVDLDGWLEEARVKVQPARRLDALLGGLPPANALVAHRHYHRTGTLRAFAVANWSGSEGDAPEVPSDYDGAVFVVPQYPDESDKTVAARITSSPGVNEAMQLFCVRKIRPSDLSVAQELATWRWIEANCQELRVDDLARREVRSRIGAAEDAIKSALRPFVNPTGEAEERWFHLGRPVRIATKGDLTRKLSEICDEVFPGTPVLRNELINRSQLSTATATARMKLLEAMVLAEAMPYLGMTGAPPERSIYLSMFHATGMHRETGGVAKFMPPKPDSNNWMPAWDAIENLLKERGAATFEEILLALAMPPIGLRRGPALLLICAFMLHRRHVVALLERSSFQPDITGAHFMRLAKSPANFSLRYIGTSKSATDVLERLAADLDIWSDGPRPQPALKDVVEAMYRWWSALPTYARETGTLSKTAKDLRDVFRKAHEPVDFIFKQIPQACGLENVDLQRKDTKYSDRLIETLNGALGEIADAFRHLRSRAETSLLEAFDALTIAALRATIRTEYATHRLHLTEYRLRTFVDRASDSEMSDDVWLDSIASLLTGKRLDAWQDDTADAFGFEVKAVGGRLTRWLAHMRVQVASEVKLVTVHIVDTAGHESMVVVRPGMLAKDAALTVGEIRKILARSKDPASVLAHVMADRLSETESKEKADGR